MTSLRRAPHKTPATDSRTAWLACFVIPPPFGTAVILGLLWEMCPISKSNIVSQTPFYIVFV